MEPRTRVTCEILDGVCEVRLVRPEKLNSLDQTMFEDLVATGRELMDRDDVRAVVLSGEGRAFCAGLDFALFARMREPREEELPARPEPLGAARALGQQVVHVWSMVPAPVIAAVHGVCFGGGLQIALGADIRIVAPDARLSMMEVQWGITPDMMGTQLLPELVGRDVAKDLALTGRTVTGLEARDIGLATRVDDHPVTAALALAREIAEHSQSATRRIKGLMDLAGRVDLAVGLQAEQEAIAALIGSDEQAAAVNRRLAMSRQAGGS